MEYPGGTANNSNTDPEEAGAADAWSCTNDTGHLGDLKPEWEKVQEEVQEETFSPGGLETRTENRMEGGVSTQNTGGGGHLGGDKPSITRAMRAEDDSEERRSRQAGHVLGRTWPSQVWPTTEMGHGVGDGNLAVEIKQKREWGPKSARESTTIGLLKAAVLITPTGSGISSIKHVTCSRSMGRAQDEPGLHPVED
ncbi:hypothetical protein NDU88_006124 [Pleurodeles waltl]|uniref:Uncharacterized protein n=1 Tax=Pleurodeles waltl TaxID=8319 RepID=A0AAV7X088_PLEWA|nr:hypothetical protein NDU88_006124 [Pleurodeles waltl]